MKSLLLGVLAITAAVLVSLMATTPVVMVFGDSIARGVAEAWPGTIDASRPSERLATALAEDSGVAGEERLIQLLQTTRPTALVILEGTNDVLEGVYRGDGAWMSQAMSALAKMIDAAQAHGVRVYVVTIPPQRVGGRRKRDAMARAIPEFNWRLAVTALVHGAVVIDAYALVLANEARYVSDDDVHLTPSGYEAVVQLIARMR